MEIRPSDLIQLRKDIERIRKHEAERKARPAGETVSDESQSAAALEDRKPAMPISVRLREMIDGLWAPSAPSKESVETIPDYLITLLQVISEEPKFRRWLLQLKGMPIVHRNQQLDRMAYAFRIEDGESPIAAAFDRLHDSPLFDAVCEYLGDDTAGPPA